MEIENKVDGVDALLKWVESKSSWEFVNEQKSYNKGSCYEHYRKYRNGGLFIIVERINGQVSLATSSQRGEVPYMPFNSTFVRHLAVFKALVKEVQDMMNRAEKLQGPLKKS